MDSRVPCGHAKSITRGTRSVLRHQAWLLHPAEQRGANYSRPQGPRSKALRASGLGPATLATGGKRQGSEFIALRVPHGHAKPQLYTGLHLGVPSKAARGNATDGARPPLRTSRPVGPNERRSAARSCRRATSGTPVSAERIRGADALDAPTPPCGPLPDAAATA